VVPPSGDVYISHYPGANFHKIVTACKREYFSRNASQVTVSSLLVICFDIHNYPLIGLPAPKEKDFQNVL